MFKFVSCFWVWQSLLVWANLVIYNLSIKVLLTGDLWETQCRNELSVNTPHVLMKSEEARLSSSSFSHSCRFCLPSAGKLTVSFTLCSLFVSPSWLIQLSPRLCFTPKNKQCEIISDQHSDSECFLLTKRSCRTNRNKENSGVNGDFPVISPNSKQPCLLRLN